MPDSNAWLITHAADLHALCQQLAPSPWLAIDTEFLRENTYEPQLCLLQIAGLGADGLVTAAVDPLALEDLTPLFEFMNEPQRVKIFHAGEQDLALIYQLSGSIPTPLFDTQIAASLAGFPAQTGYANLISELLDVQLDKQLSRTNWTRRPLSAAELRYAIDDVFYLGQAYEILRDQLMAQERLEWLDHEFNKLADTNRYTAQPARAWLRIKGGNRLRPAQQAALEQLAQWREEEAIAQNKPRGWIIKDVELLDLARIRPKQLTDLQRLQGFAENKVQRYGKTLLQLIANAPAQPVLSQPRRKPLTPEEDAVVDVLMAVLRLQSQHCGIAASTLGNRKELEKILQGERNTPLLTTWRRAAAGDAILAMLDGDKTAQVNAGQLVIV